MITAYNEAKKQGIPCSLIEDAELTKFGGQVTITAAKKLTKLLEIFNFCKTLDSV